MSPITAMTFLMSASGVLFLGVARGDGGSWFRLTSLAGLGVLATGAVVVLGYIEGTPILYGGRIIPVALLTAVSFVLTGLGLITACGPQVEPVKSFVGPSVRSILMRSFFPVVVFFVFVDDYIYRWLLPEATNPVLKDALIDIVSTIVVGIIIAEIAKKVGGGMDRARKEKTAAEEELRETAQRLGLATNSGRLGVWDWDVSSNAMIWNDRMFELYGIAREDFPRCIDAWTNGLHPDDRASAIAECEAALRGEREFNTEFRVQHADGTIKWLKADAIIIRDATGAAVRMIGLNRDITEMRHAEDQVRLSLHERETLLRELYHRTKNNMQVISSLLNLQSAALDDPAARQAFTDARSRIQAMSLVHEKLYQSTDLSSLDLGSYIRDLAQSILQGYKTEKGKISLRLELAAHSAPIDFVTPIGLVINELMSNSLKYAFPDSRQGEIFITLSKEDDHCLAMRYQDNGVGLSGLTDLRQSKTLGMQLVYGLVETQLKGRIEVTAGEGSGMLFSLQFSALPPVHE
jgi:PAS domain S-box-containing protein